MAREVVITGSGVVSFLGDTPGDVFRALLRAADRPSEATAPPATERLSGCPAYALDTFAPERYLGERNLRALDRGGQLLASAARLALDSARYEPDRLKVEEVGLVAGTMFSSVQTTSRFDRHAQTAGPGYASPMDFANTVINAPAGQTAIFHGLRGPNWTVTTGAASGLSAFAQAADMIRTGRAGTVLAAGFEELSPESYHGFRSSGRLSGAVRPRPFERQRCGFALSEGAAALVLEDVASARSRGARPLALLVGHGQGFDATRGRDTERAVGAMSRAITAALADAGLTARDVDCVSASARGDVAGDTREAEALARTFSGRGADLVVTAPKAFGEGLGASGAIQAVAAVEVLGRGVVPGVPGFSDVEHPFLRQKLSAENRPGGPRTILVNSFGFDGHCCALLLSACPGRSEA